MDNHLNTRRRSNPHPLLMPSVIILLVISSILSYIIPSNADQIAPTTDSSFAWVRISDDYNSPDFGQKESFHMSLEDFMTLHEQYPDGHHSFQVEEQSSNKLTPDERMQVAVELFRIFLMKKSGQ